MRRPVCIMGLAFVVIMLIYMYMFPLPEPSFDGIDKREAYLTGRVSKKEYRISYGKESLVIYLKEVQIINPHEYLESETDLSGLEGVLCYMENTVEPRLGSRIYLRGKLRSFNRATNPGEFDARSYYNILNMQMRLQSGVILEESAEYDVFAERMWEIKKYMLGLADICFGDDAHIMKAMLLGEKSGLEEDTKLLYQMNGVIHILSISGLHISIIGMGLYKALRRLRCPTAVNVFVSVCLMYCYGVMTGMGISTIRAIVMFAFHIAAGLFGRTYDMLTAMAVVGVAILAGQPLYLYHSGFLFSFGAVLAIGVFLPAVEENFIGGRRFCKVMSTSLSISIATLPIYLCFYYEYPLYSIILNIIIIPGTGLLVSGGLFVLALSMLYLPLSRYAALPIHLILGFYERFCSLMLRLPKSRCIVGKPESWQLFLFAFILIYAVAGNAGKSKLQFWQWVLAALLCISMRFEDGLAITTLDVGQGDSIYISDCRGGHYLIDGGSSSKTEVGAYQILPFLKEEGTDRLDAVFITHMDSDHYNGIAAVIEDMAQGGVTIDNLIMPDIGEKSKDDAYHELVGLAQEQGIRVLYIHRGDTLQHGKLKLTCLHPEEGEDGTDTNAASTVLYLEYEAFTALFTGDLEGEGETAVTELLGGGDKDAAGKALTGRGRKNNITLLKVAHHGSRNSTTQAFTEAAAPNIALISAGKDNRYGHPHTETLERLENAGCLIYRTDEGGALTVRYHNSRVWVEEFLE